MCEMLVGCIERHSTPNKAMAHIKSFCLFFVSLFCFCICVMLSLRALGRRKAPDLSAATDGHRL